MAWPSRASAQFYVCPYKADFVLKFEPENPENQKLISTQAWINASAVANFCSTNYTLFPLTRLLAGSFYRPHVAQVQWRSALWHEGNSFILKRCIDYDVFAQMDKQFGGQTQLDDDDWDLFEDLDDDFDEAVDSDL